MKKNFIIGIFCLTAFIAGSPLISAQKVVQATSATALSETVSAPQALLVEDFTSAAGTLLTAAGWTAHSGAGTNSIAVTSPGLTYSGYPSSGIGNAVTMTTSGEDAHRTFLPQTSGSVYASLMVNVTEAAIDPANLGGYFFHLGPDPIGTTFRGRIYIKKDASNNIAFGITKASTSVLSDIQFTGFTFSLNTTYLLVVKYTIVAGATNDTVSLFINPALDGAEPAPTVTAPDFIATDINPASVALRQGTAATHPTVRVDGIRVGQAWGDVTGTITPPKKFETNMSGANEVPPNASTAQGYGRVILNEAETQITASMYYNGLSTGTTAGHIHRAAVGINGPIIFDMAPTPGQTSGSAVDRIFAVTPTQVADLKAGLWYFNVHTTAFPGGEIRGQILVADAPADFNGDGRTDYAITRDSGGQKTWWIQYNGTSGSQVSQFGVDTDQVAPADYDGDGKTDLAVWREPPTMAGQAVFYIFQSLTGTVRIELFGLTGDQATSVGDYDGDGKADVSVYREGAGPGSQSFFFYRGSLNNPNGNVTYLPWGIFGDVQTSEDFDGDGKFDVCVRRDAGGGKGLFYLLRSSDSTVEYIYWGLTTDNILPGDYDGDGKYDFAVARLNGDNYNLYILERDGGGTGAFPIVFASDSQNDGAAFGDYDGDGRTDIAIFRPTAPGYFWVRLASNGSVSVFPWGTTGDESVGDWNITGGGP